MYRFLIFALMLGLSACVVEPADWDVPADDADQVELDTSDQQLELSGGLDGEPLSPAADDVAQAAADDDALCGNPWECFCAQFKTPETCKGSCVWWPNRCTPTYE